MSKQEIIKKLQDILNSSKVNNHKETLSPHSLYKNIYHSTGTLTHLSTIFEVPQNIIKEIKDIKILKEDMTIANTIKQQLLALDANALMCWGSSNFRGSGPEDPHHNGYLIFNIRNVKNIDKGYIQILLNYKDLYDIKIFNSKHSKPIFTFNDVFVDILIDTIGENIGF